MHGPFRIIPGRAVFGGSGRVRTAGGRRCTDVQPARRAPFTVFKPPFTVCFSSTSLSISRTTPRVHPAAQEILRRARAVSRELGIVDNDLYRHHTTMTNYLYVDAPVERMVNAVVTYDVLYYLDDFYGEDTKTGIQPDFRAILGVWTGQRTAADFADDACAKLYRAVEYIATAIRRDSPAEFFARYTQSVVEHLSYALQDRPFRTVAEYVDIRLRTGGMLPVLDLIEYTEGLYLNEELTTAVPALRELRRTAALIGALSNDIFSYAKERHSDYNLVNAYLKTGEAATFEEAVERSVTLVNNLHAEFDAWTRVARSQVQSMEQGAGVVGRYLRALEVIIASCYHWQKSTDRYRHPENVFEDMRA